MMTLRTSKSGSMFLTARRNVLTGMCLVHVVLGTITDCCTLEAVLSRLKNRWSQNLVFSVEPTVFAAHKRHDCRA